MPRKKQAVHSLNGTANYRCTSCEKRFVCPEENLYKQGWHNINTISLTMICGVECLFKKRKRHKFNAKQSESDGITFSSKAERAYYNRLKLLQQSGEVLFFLRQTPIHLPGNTKYLVDFQVFYADGTVAFIDVKGMSTPMFVLKKKQVEDLYPITIEIVK